MAETAPGRRPGGGGGGGGARGPTPPGDDGDRQGEPQCARGDATGQGRGERRTRHGEGAEACGTGKLIVGATRRRGISRRARASVATALLPRPGCTHHTAGGPPHLA